MLNIYNTSFYKCTNVCTCLLENYLGQFVFDKTSTISECLIIMFALKMRCVLFLHSLILYSLSLPFAIIWVYFISALVVFWLALMWKFSAKISCFIFSIVASFFCCCFLEVYWTLGSLLMHDLRLPRTYTQKFVNHQQQHNTASAATLCNLYH